MQALVCVNIVSGDLTAASTLNQQLKNLTISIDYTAYIAWSLYFQGIIHFCRNELDMAILHFSKSAEIFYATLRRGNVDCLAGLTLAYQARQQTDNATATLERLFEYIHFLDDPVLLNIAHSCRERLALMKEETPFASGVPSINKTSNDEAMFLWLEVPVITQCRVLLAEGSDTDFQEAEKKLQECLCD